MCFISANVLSMRSTHEPVPLSQACKLQIRPLLSQTMSTIRSDTRPRVLNLIREVNFIPCEREIDYLCYWDPTFSTIWITRRVLKSDDRMTGIWQNTLCTGKPNVLTQVKEVRFGAGRIGARSHMPRIDQWLAFSPHNGSD